MHQWRDYVLGHEVHHRSLLYTFCFLGPLLMILGPLDDAGSFSWPLRLPIETRIMSCHSLKIDCRPPAWHPSRLFRFTCGCCRSCRRANRYWRSDCSKLCHSNLLSSCGGARMTGVDRVVGKSLLLEACLARNRTSHLACP